MRRAVFFKKKRLDTEGGNGYWLLEIGYRLLKIGYFYLENGYKYEKMVIYTEGS